MIKVKQLDVGPIIGESTATRVRVWGRALPPKEVGLKTHGVVRFLLEGVEVGRAYFKMQWLWDYTGVGIIEGLSKNTTYEYQIGWFESEDDTSALVEDEPRLNWYEIGIHKAKTASDDVTEARSYLVGSCRYNLPWTSDDKETTDTRGDKTFKAMNSHIEEHSTNGLIMLGDQIYADVLGVGVDSREGFHRLYRGAFKQDSLRAVMSKLPTYMTLDDHEIEDNWPERQSDDDMHKLNAAKYAYQSYQVSHSPLLDIRNGRLDGLPDKFWYQFSDGCCDFFMMDVRTERVPKKGQMVSRYQMDALKSFLRHAGDKVKVIGTAVPFFPDGGDDKWSGYPSQRNEILEFIKVEKIRKVVFIAGDVHFSAGCELSCVGDSDFKVLSFMCSPFFWPFPHWAGVDYDDIKSENATFVINKKSDEYRKENFVRFDFSVDSVGFKVYPRRGNEPVLEHDYQW